MVDDLKRAALSALRLSLRPIFRILLRSGVTWQEAAEVCKITLVEVATHHFGLHGRPTNMSRVAIMTGLGRREVKRLRELLAAEPVIESGRMNGATRVLTGWYLDPEFTDATGNPLDLPFDGASSSTFTSLCKRYAGDLATVTMRRELVRVGAMGELGGGRVRVLTRFYRPLQMDPDAVLRGGSMLEDLGTTVSHNLGKQTGESSRFAGRATNSRVRPAAAHDFREFLEQDAQAFLERADAWLSRHEVAGTANDRQGRTVRLGVGVYYIEEERKP